MRMVFFGGPIALGLFQNVLVLRAGGHTAFYACHFWLLTQTVRRPGLHRAVSAFDSTLVPRFWRIYLPLWLISRWRLPATPCFSLTGGGELEALLDAALGLELGHFGPFILERANSRGSP